MPSPEPRPDDEMLSLVTRQAAYRVGRRARHRRVLKLAPVVVLVMSIAAGVLFVAARSGTSAKFETVGNRIASDEAPEVSIPKDGGESSGGGGRNIVQAPSGRDVISTGSVTVRVADVEASATEAAAIATDAGGYVSKLDSKLEGDQQITLTLRVPANQFGGAMDQAADLGELQSRTMAANDVTDQVIDLEGRLKTAQTSATRLRELLVDAENVQNLIAVEDRLSQKENEIEQLTREVKSLDDQVTYATVGVTLTEQDDTPKVSRDLPGPLEALRSGAVAFVNVALAAVAAVAFALPFLFLALLGWWLVRRWRQRGVA